MKKINFLYKLLVSSFVISSFSEGIILPIYAVFVQKIGGDILDAGGAMGTFLITEGLFTILVHRRQWSYKQRIALMIGGWIIWLSGIISYLVISSVLMLFMSQVLIAIGNAIADPVFDQELANHTDQEKEETEFAIFEGSKSIVDGLAAVLGGIVATFFGWQSLIYLMIITASISLLIILIYVVKIFNKQPAVIVQA